MKRKAALYASFGVRELWVIDAAWLTGRAHRGPAPRETLDFGSRDLLALRFAPAAFAPRLGELELE